LTFDFTLQKMLFKNMQLRTTKNTIVHGRYSSQHFDFEMFIRPNDQFAAAQAV